MCFLTGGDLLSTSTFTDHEAKAPHRSVSQLKSYARCSEQYRLERVARIKSPPAAWTIRGTAFHRAVEVWEMSDRTADPLAVYFEEYDRGIEEARQVEPDISKWPRPLSWSAETTITRYREKAADAVRAYVAEATNPECQWSIAELPDGSPAVEVPFRVLFGDIEVIGYIDQINDWTNGATTVRDLKAGSGNDARIQLGTYKIVANELLGMEVNYGDYWSGKKLGSTGMIDLSRFTREFLEAQYKALDNGIRNEVYLPSPDESKCKMCGVRQFCREQGDQWSQALIFSR